MKKVIVFLLIVGMSGICFGALQTDNVEDRLVKIIKSVKNLAVSTAVTIGNLNQDGKDIVQGYGSDISQADKTALIALDTKISTAKAALDDLNDYIVATWGSIE